MALQNRMCQHRVEGHKMNSKFFKCKIDLMLCRALDFMGKIQTKYSKKRKTYLKTFLEEN